MELKEMSRQSHMASKGLHLRAKLLYSLSVKVDQMIPKVPALVWSPEKQRMDQQQKSVRRLVPPSRSGAQIREG